jgi:hypothetical protein
MWARTSALLRGVVRVLRIWVECGVSDVVCVQALKNGKFFYLHDGIRLE